MVTQNNKGFTLIELLVGISISTILMLSIGFLITGGIKNITSQEKNLQNSRDISDFQSKLNDIFFNIDTSFKPIITNSGVIVKINQNYDEGGFAYIGETSQNEFYCLSGSENTQTKHIFIKTFIPYGTDYTKSKSHKIDGIGKSIFGYTKIPKDGIEKDKVYLNNPTGKTSSGTIDFISDTLNNRILYKSGSKVYELLNREDGLSEPTDLYLKDGILYIANSGNGEILKYSSKNIPTPDLTLTGITANNIDNFTISFYNNNGNKIFINKGNITIENHTIVTNDKYKIKSSPNNNKLEFTYSGGTDQNFNNNYITISNLKNFSGYGTYYIKLSINNKFYKFFTQGDNNILTKDDNTLESLIKDGNYYTKINTILNYDHYSPNSSNLSYNKKYDYILRNPIKSESINFDSTKKLLNLELDYYNKYNCYNLEEKSSKILILKKNYK